MDIRKWFKTAAAKSVAPRQQIITEERVQRIANDGRARRIHFPTTHAKALKRTEGQGWVGSFSVPFEETIKPLFQVETDLELFPSRVSEGVWRSIRDDREYRLIESWIEKQNNRVFLRDTLALSLALDLNFYSDQTRTMLGDLEDRAKYKQDESAISGLVHILVQNLSQLPFYNTAATISAVPPSSGKEFDLPTILAARVAKACGLIVLTSGFRWKAQKGSLKDMPAGDKWANLVRADLTYQGPNLDNKAVILLDDLYQSGQTMQYVAMTLLDAGAKEIYGMAIVKSWRDSDNQ